MQKSNFLNNHYLKNKINHYIFHFCHFEYQFQNNLNLKQFFSKKLLNFQDFSKTLITKDSQTFQINLFSIKIKLTFFNKNI